MAYILLLSLARGGRCMRCVSTSCTLDTAQCPSCWQLLLTGEETHTAHCTVTSINCIQYMDAVRMAVVGQAKCRLAYSFGLGWRCRLGLRVSGSTFQAHVVCDCCHLPCTSCHQHACSIVLHTAQASARTHATNTSSSSTHMVADDGADAMA